MGSGRTGQAGAVIMFALYLLIALQIIDLFSTVIALRLPGMSEGNPVLKPLFDKFGAIPVMVSLKLVFCLLLVSLSDQVPSDLLWLMCLVYVWISFSNIQLIRASR